MVILIIFLALVVDCSDYNANACRVTAERKTKGMQENKWELSKTSQ